DMCREKELIDGYDLREAIIALEEDAGVARKAGRIAGDGGHAGNAGCCKLARLRLRALPRRIEHHCLERFEFAPPQWVAKQITLLRRDGLEPRGSCRGAPQGRKRVRLAVNCSDAGALDKAQREWSDAAEQVGHGLRISTVQRHQPCQYGFAGRSRLQE